MPTRRIFAYLLSLTSVAWIGAACTPEDDTTDASSAEVSVPAICTQAASGPFPSFASILRERGQKNALEGDTPKLKNYTAWPTYDPKVGWTTAAYDPSIVAARATADEARKNLASRYGACADKMQKHLATKKPNVYLYFTGFGSGTQQNSLIDQPSLIKWLNDRDPNALVFSINWSCKESHDGFCRDNGAKLAVHPESPEYKSMIQKVTAVLGAGAKGQLQGVLDQVDARNRDYNEGLSHAMQLAALLIDQVLVADIGDVRLLGYSMGAHAASQVMIQDFVGDGSGFAWTAPGVCDDGKAACTVSHLTKVKWALSLGLSGWSEAGIADVATRSADVLAQYKNGGLYRVRDDRFNGKANVFNRRMDPTGNSNDIYERGFNALFGEYNHYSHDYAMPVFTSWGFTQLVDAFLESKDVNDVPELGAYYDNAGLVDFDECAAGGSCAAKTGYVDHAAGSHAKDEVPVTAAVTTTDGVPHRDRKTNRAVSFVDTKQPIALRTFDQEDLRGGVELYFRPQFDLAAKGVHGLFSYGTCSGADDDLMPTAYLENGELVFETRWLGKPYRATIAADDAKVGLKKGRWTHLAFTWDLPTVAMATAPTDPAALPAFMQSFGESAQKYGQSFVIASGLRDAPPTTYKRQAGAGTMTIFVNGKPAVTAPLGTADSERGCLARSEVIGESTYNPYGYSSDALAAPPGTLCKAYRIRHVEALFGCAKSEGVTAEGDMDDIALVWGPGRTEYANVGENGAPKPWPIGPKYDAKPFVIP